MLTRVELINVRRHAHTEIHFDEDDQLILLDGPNEAGKTTILEAVMWAFYGETRHGHKRGRRGMGGLVRRGAEHEGAEVNVDFTINNTNYHVKRRWEKGKSTAVLSAGTTPIMRGVDEVTKEITRLIGVDASGFKLSAVAKQTDRDELVNLDPAKRRAAVARLLKHDALAGAGAAARDQYRAAAQKTAALTSAIAAQRETMTVEQATTMAEQAGAARDGQQQVVTDLDIQISAHAPLVTDYHTRNSVLIRAQAAAEHAHADADNADAAATQAEHAIIDPGPAPHRDAAAIEIELEQVRDTLAAAKNAAATAATITAVTASIDKAAAERDTAERTYLTGGYTEADADAEAAAAAAAVAAENYEQARRVSQAAATAAAVADSNAERAHAHVAAVSALSDTCPTCDQTITDTHHTSMLADAQKRADTCQATAAAAHNTADQAGAACEQARAQSGAANAAAAAASEKAQTAARLRDTVTACQRAIDTHTSTLERLSVTTVDADINDLHARRALLEAERAVADAYVSAVAAAAASEKAAADARARAEHAAAAAALADTALAAAALPADLEQAAGAHAALVIERNNEADILTELSAAAAAASEALTNAQETAANLATLNTALADAQHQALLASKASAALSACAKTAAAAAGPTLERELSSILAQLSDGRFSAARVDADYTITVADTDGTWQPISEYSGGAIALIGLAIRLALAKMVTGTGGVHGFLILDEVLGNQDPGRQSSILAGLRKLRTTYGQILIISHIPGVRDETDRVIVVGTDDDGVADVTG